MLRQRFKDAQKVTFPGVEETSNQHIDRLLNAHAKAIGCPVEFLYFPFVSTCAGKFLKYDYPFYIQSIFQSDIEYHANV